VAGRRGGQRRFRNGNRQMQALKRGANLGTESLPLRAARAVLEGILVAARWPRSFAIFAPVGILLARPAACAAFGKIIVCGNGQGGPPCGWVSTARTARASLRNGAGRVRGRKSKRLHGAHYTPASARAG
jgi:hypothetical protein